MLKQLRLTVFTKAIIIAHFFVVSAHGMLSSRLASRFIANKFVRSGVEKILYRFLPQPKPQPKLTQLITPSIPRTLFPKNQRLIHTQPKLRQQKPTQPKLPTRNIVKPPQDRVLQKSRVPHQPVNRFELSHSPWSKNRFMSKMFYGGIGPAVGLGIVAGSKIVAIGEEFLSIVESIIYEKELFKKIEQNDDSIIPMLEKIFVTKEKSKLAEKVFKKLIETEWGIIYLASERFDSLLKTNPEVAKSLVAVLVADVNNLELLLKNFYGCVVFASLVKDSNVAKQFTSVLAADVNNLIKLCNYNTHVCLNPFGYLLEKDPSAAEQFTLLAVDANIFTQLCKKYAGLLIIKALLEKDPNAAKQFTPLAADANNFVQLCKTEDGRSILETLLEKDPSSAEQFTLLAADASFDLCKEESGGRKILKLITTKNPSMLSQLPDTVVHKTSPYLFYLLTKNSSCGDIKEKLVEKSDGNTLGLVLKRLIYCHNYDNNHEAKTQTSKHIKNNLKRVVKTKIVHEALQKPGVAKMLDSVFKKEQALQSDYYTFVHGQQWKFALLEPWFTQLWSLKNNQSCKDFLFPHLEKPQDNKDQLIQEKKLRKETLDKGGNRNRLQFLNWGLFSNCSDLGSNSISYVLNNSNGSLPLAIQEMQGRGFSIKSIFDNLGYTHIYEKYKDQLSNLEQEHNNLSEHGQMLLFAVPKDKIKDCVYLTRAGGPKVKISIDGIGDTDDINIIMETLRNNPEKIADTDRIQFALVKTWDFALNPEKSGIKVFPFNAADADSEKVKEFRAKEEELFRQIKQDIMQSKPLDQMQDGHTGF